MLWAVILCLACIPAACTKQPKKADETPPANAVQQGAAANKAQPGTTAAQGATTAQMQPVKKSEAVSEAVRLRRVDELQKAYEGVVSVKAATEVGVSYINYSPRLANAATALAVYIPEDDDARSVASALAAALDDYKSAGDVWTLKIRDRDSEWSDFAYRHTEMISALHLNYSYATDSEYDRAVQYFWSLGSAHMDAAQMGFATYKSH
jgi:hypothetical protein